MGNLSAFSTCGKTHRRMVSYNLFAEFCAFCLSRLNIRFENGSGTTPRYHRSRTINRNTEMQSAYQRSQQQQRGGYYDPVLLRTQHRIGNIQPPHQTHSFSEHQRQSQLTQPDLYLYGSYGSSRQTQEATTSSLWRQPSTTAEAEGIQWRYESSPYSASSGYKSQQHGTRENGYVRPDDVGTSRAYSFTSNPGDGRSRTQGYENVQPDDERTRRDNLLIN